MDDGKIRVIDYILSALDGLNSDNYVPNSKTCANNTKYFQIDAERFKTKLNTRPAIMILEE